MTNGTIVVGGSAGLEIGMRMKRGLIVIGGAVRDFTGLEMKGGTIILRSGAELRTGAWMSRGTIISLRPIPLLPSFLYATTYIHRSWVVRQTPRRTPGFPDAARPALDSASR